MAFWKKTDKPKDAESVKPTELGRNDPCHCGSGKKYKKCCLAKDEAAEHKSIEEAWTKSAAAAKADAEKKAKEAPSAPPTSKHGGPPSSAQPKHQTFIPTQVNLPRKSGGG